MNITAEIVFLFLAVMGGVGGAWWRIQTQVSQVRDELAGHRLHTAETYVSKQGHRESTEMLLSAITEVKSAIDGTNQRIDRMFDGPKTTRRAS